MKPYKICRAMFDVRPITKSGVFLVPNSTSLLNPLDLKINKNNKVSVETTDEHQSGELITKNISKINNRDDLLAELENEMNLTIDLAGELSSIGAQVEKESSGEQLRARNSIPMIQEVKVINLPPPPDNLPVLGHVPEKNDGEIRFKKLPSLQESILGRVIYNETPEIKEQSKRISGRNNIVDEFMARKSISSPASREVEVLLTGLKGRATRKSETIIRPQVKEVSHVLVKGETKKWIKKYLLSIIAVVFSLSFIQGGLSLKTNLLNDGNRAVINLEKAKVNLEEFDFISAANDFALAGKNFSQISKKLNLVGASIASLFANVPGLDKVKAAKDIASIGEDVSLAGERISNAFSELSRTNFVSFFASEGGSQPLSDSINLFRESIVIAKEKIDHTQSILATIDTSIIPEDKQPLFLDLKEKIPLFQTFLNGAVDYSDFLLEVVGVGGPRSYLVLFQNNSELRPTGGFPGTYGLLEFDKGYLMKIFIDDIYNPDGQIREYIIPPKELQHITPTWGMRDANWFADFRISAEKVMEMYKKDGGVSVDGVISFTPTVVSRILEVIGPIEMEDYGISLDSENFLALVQSEVEYGDNKDINQPKKIVIDFVPEFMSRLAEQDSGQWLKIFEILMDGMIEKHILAYFVDDGLQDVVEDNNFAGLITKTDDDFLLVTHTNIKGAKTDAVIDNTLSLDSRITEGGFVEHTLKITRKHNGGNTPYGFYNRQNPDYIRVLVPSGSELLSIRGNSRINPQAITDYDQGDFVIDKDLEYYEQLTAVTQGTKIFRESGKTVFGFWMLIDPGETENITLKYVTPVKISSEYSLIVQKQPGTVNDKFEFKFELPENSEVTYRYPQNFAPNGEEYLYEGNLLTDLTFGLRWR